jgi:hypothetical protein
LDDELSCVKSNLKLGLLLTLAEDLLMLFDDAETVKRLRAFFRAAALSRSDPAETD